MKIDWTTLLTTLGTAGITVTAVAWLLKSLVSHWLTKDLERHKDTLQRELQFAQARFSQLHDRRADVIHELYKRIVRIRSMCHALRSDERELAEKGRSRATDEIIAEIVKTNFFFGENALYFPQSVRTAFAELFSKGMIKPLLAVGMFDEIGATKAAIPQRLEMVRDALLPSLMKDVASLDSFILKLEREFQKLLGMAEP